MWITFQPKSTNININPMGLIFQYDFCWFFIIQTLKLDNIKIYWYMPVLIGFVFICVQVVIGCNSTSKPMGLIQWNQFSTNGTKATWDVSWICSPSHYWIAWVNWITNWTWNEFRIESWTSNEVFKWIVDLSWNAYYLWVQV